MFVPYLAVTTLTVIAISYAAYLNFIGHESVIAVAERVGVPQTLTIPFGGLFAAAALGLLAGFVVPAIGTAAATGLVLYFLGAIAAHLRVRDYQGLTNPAIFLSLATGTLAAALAYHGPW